MTAPLFLPVWFGLLAIGWLAGRHWDRIIEWSARMLDADEAPASVHPLAWRHPSTVPTARSNVKVLRPPVDGGGDAA